MVTDGYHILHSHSENFTSVFNKLLQSNETTRFHGNLLSVCVLKLVPKIPELNEQEKEEFETCLTDYFSLKVNKSTLLLHAAFNDFSRPLSATSLKTIQLFLKLGAHRNTMDEYGKTPLLLLAEKWNSFSNDTCLFFKI